MSKINLQLTFLSYIPQFFISHHFNKKTEIVFQNISFLILERSELLPYSYEQKIYIIFKSHFHFNKNLTYRNSLFKNYIKTFAR